MSAAVSRLLLRRAPWPELVPLWLASAAGLSAWATGTRSSVPVLRLLCFSAACWTVVGGASSLRTGVGKASSSSLRCADGPDASMTVVTLSHQRSGGLLGFSDLGRHPFREPPPSLSAQELAIQAGPLVITAKNVRRKVAAESVAALYTDITRQREALPSHGNAFFIWLFFLIPAAADSDPPGTLRAAWCDYIGLQLAHLFAGDVACLLLLQPRLRWPRWPRGAS